MALDSALNFRSHVREKIISAGKRIIYYDDFIYYTFDESTLKFTKKLETVQYSAVLLSVGPGEGLISVNSPKNLDGNTFITEYGTDA